MAAECRTDDNTRSASTDHIMSMLSEIEQLLRSINSRVTGLENDMISIKSKLSKMEISIVKINAKKD